MASKIYSDTGPFAIVPEWLLDHPGISDGAIRQYAILARHADSGGGCVPSRRTLAERQGCSMDTVDRRNRELVEAGALAIRARKDDAGDPTSNLYLVARVRPGSRVGAATGSRVGAAQNENHLELDPLTGVSAMNGAPDGRVSTLVSGYVDDYRSERQGQDPARAFKAACGKAVKSALKDGVSVEDIARCLGVIAHESKNPSTLPYVLADMHANRPRRML